MQQRTRRLQHKVTHCGGIHWIRKGNRATRDNIQGNEKEGVGTARLKKRSCEVKEWNTWSGEALLRDPAGDMLSLRFQQETSE